MFGKGKSYMDFSFSPEMKIYVRNTISNPYGLGPALRTARTSAMASAPTRLMWFAPRNNLLKSGLLWKKIWPRGEEGSNSDHTCVPRQISEFLFEKLNQCSQIFIRSWISNYIIAFSEKSRASNEILSDSMREPVTSASHEATFCEILKNAPKLLR